MKAELRGHIIRETFISYVAPVLVVTAISFAAHKAELRVAALTSIGGTSALTALAAGLLLSGYPRIIAQRSRLASILLLALGGMAAMTLLATSVNVLFQWLDPGTTGARRLWVDLPISGFLGAGIIAWRLHAYLGTATARDLVAINSYWMNRRNGV